MRSWYEPRKTLGLNKATPSKNREGRESTSADVNPRVSRESETAPQHRELGKRCYRAPIQPWHLGYGDAQDEWELKIPAQEYAHRSLRLKA